MTNPDPETPEAPDAPGRDPARPDPEAPGNYVDDPDAAEVPEPNEPG